MLKKKILGTFLTLSLCSLIFPIIGLAESNVYSIKNQPFEKVINIEGKQLKVKQQVTKRLLLDEDVVEMANYASKAVSEEKEKDRKG